MKYLQLDHDKIEIREFNNDFVLLRSADDQKMAGLGQALFEADFDFVDEVIATEIEICLKLNSKYNSSKILLLKNLIIPSEQDKQLLKMPVYFDDNEDWKEVEKISGLDKSRIIEILSNSQFNVAMLGFLPGFVYLDGLPEILHIPRKGKPSKYIAPNSMAIGGQYLGTYSIASPGGWHVIGKMACSLLQLPQIPPILINPAHTLELEAIDQSTYEKLSNSALNILQYNGQS